MDRNETLLALQSLRMTIINYESAKNELSKATETLKKAEARQPRAVYDFDQKNKQAYVLSHIGPEPIKPKGIIKLVHRSKMKEYEKEYSLYTSKLDKCVASYYEEYADKRKKLESEEQAEIAYELQCAQNQYNIIQERVSLLHSEINENTILSEKMKKKKSVDTLIEYFQDQRADSIKEAVNLYFEEEHRRRLEEFAQEQVRLTAEAAEQARQAAESAEEAAASADEAISRVDSALERANEAYEKAEEAYSEAQNAYYAATTNND